MANGEATFIEITNKMIYQEIRDLKKMHQQNFEELRENQLITNGKVKKAYWIATTALSLTVLAIGFLIQHIGG